MHSANLLVSMLVVVLVLLASPTSAKDWIIGSGGDFANLQEFAEERPKVLLAGGDNVIIKAGTYNLGPRSDAGGTDYGADFISIFLDRLGSANTASNPITIKGDPSGARPVLHFAGSGLDYGLLLYDDPGVYYVIQYLEISGTNDGTFAENNVGGQGCLHHKAFNTIVRDVIIHDCRQGIVGNDDGGSITVEYSEFYDNGAQSTNHQLYIATGSDDYPNSFFRLQYCYVHDGLGGNGVKSRATRNEIYYNWLEHSNSQGRPLELIGTLGDDTVSSPADVVGNVLIKEDTGSSFGIIRLGTDESGQVLRAPVRFVNNHFILAPQNSYVMVLNGDDAVSELHLYNNIFFTPKSGSGSNDFLRFTPSASYTIHASNNWVHTTRGLTGLPAGAAIDNATSDPGFTNPGEQDYTLRDGSVCIGAALVNPPTHGFSNPETVSGMPGTHHKINAAIARPNREDLGAFQFGTTDSGPSDGSSDGSDGDGGDGSAASNLQPLIAAFLTHFKPLLSEFDEVIS